MKADWTIVLSGPLAHRAPLLAALQRASVDLSEGQPEQGASHGLPPEGPEVAWLTVRHADLAAVVEHAGRAGWALRIHWPTPPCPAGCVHGRANQPDGSGLGACPHCGGSGHSNRPMPPFEQRVVDELVSLRERLDRVERGSR